MHEQGLLDIPGSDVTCTVWEFKITSALSLNATVKSRSLESAAQVSNRDACKTGVFEYVKGSD